MTFRMKLLSSSICIATLQFFSLCAAQTPDASGYVLPSSGTASTTQFNFGSELASGTACGAGGWPNGASAPSGSPGGGPGFLYAAINQLAFGANSLGANAGGPGAACGLCYQLTPVAADGTVLSAQATTFMIVDECPVSGTPVDNNNCGQCKVGDTNIFGQNWHFDIASDAMNQDQYNTFYQGVTDGSNWLNVHFTETSCNGATSPDPTMKDWGCMDGHCPNNAAANVCQGVSDTHTLEDGTTIVNGR